MVAVFASPLSPRCCNSLLLFRAARVTGCAWSFGDGAISSEQNSTNPYETGNDYTVTLKVSGAECFDTATQVDAVFVSELFSFFKKLRVALSATEGRLGADAHAAELRNFRDNQLAISFSGRFLIAPYCLNSPELIRFFETNPELKQEFGDIFEPYAPLIGQGLPGARQPLTNLR